MKRIRYYDRNKKEVCYGTLRDNGDIICDYCGGFIKCGSDEYEVLETWSI